MRERLFQEARAPQPDVPGQTEHLAVSLAIMVYAHFVLAASSQWQVAGDSRWQVGKR